MDKNRPEVINLNTPSIYADKLETMLTEVLAKRSKLKRTDNDGKTNFQFHPTKSEYFLISVKLHCLAEELNKEENL